jgi:DNA repair exonuclease SbcCD ATPase subunit
MNIADLKKEVESKISQVDTVSDYIREYEQDIVRLREEKKSMLEEFDLNTRTLSSLIILFDKLNEQGLGKLTELMENTLNKIYPKRNYRVEYEVREIRKGNHLTFYLIETKGGKEIRSDIKNSVGGSIRAICGLLCCIYYAVKKDSVRFLGFDESLSQIDSVAFDKVFQMLKTFGEDLGFKYLIMTHDDRFSPYIDRTYNVSSDGIVSEVGE